MDKSLGLEDEEKLIEIEKGLQEIAQASEETTSLKLRLEAACKLVHLRILRLSIIVERSLVRAKEKVDNLLKSIFEELNYVLKNSESQRPSSSSDTLFIVMTPEFAFNGFWTIGNRNRKNLKFSALQPIPSRLELYIQDAIHRILQREFSKYKILFIFSCCSYDIFAVETFKFSTIEAKWTEQSAMMPTYGITRHDSINLPVSEERRLSNGWMNR